MRILKDKVGMFSDIHIGVHGASPQWHTISLEYAKWLKQELLARDIKDLIIPGDVLDDRNDVSVLTLHYLPQFFKILDCFNIIISVGNHDCFYSKRSDVHSLNMLNGWENITIIDKPVTITAHDKIISFCPWNTNIKTLQKSDIIFGHFDIQSFEMANRRVCDNGFSSEELLNIGQLIVTGHFHLTQERHYKNGTILYLGSPYELNWAESMSPKGFYVLDIPSQKFEFVKNTISPKHRKIRLSELINLGKVNDDIKKEFEGNIIKFVIDVEANPQTIDSLIKKFSLLRPLEIKVEYEFSKQFELLNESFDIKGINVQSDIVEFIKSLENVDSKDEIVKYLADIYDRAEVLIK